MKSLFVCLVIFPVIAFAQTYVSGPVTGTWDLSGSPYFVIDTVFIPPTESLIIAPGVL